MDIKISQTFGLLRFPLIVLVVFVHTFQGPVLVDGTMHGVQSDVYNVIGNIISHNLASVAVPTFFFISGYLYFKEQEFNLRLYKQKSFSRGRSLLVPYLIWNTWVLLFMLVVQFIGSWLGIEFTGRMIWDYGWSDFLAAYWKQAGGNYPINFPLWYIRDLMIVCVFTPFVYCAVRYVPMLVTILIAIWIGISACFQIYLSISFVFFTLGAYTVINKLTFIDGFKSWWSRITLVFPLLVCVPAFSSCAGNFIWVIRLVVGVYFVLNLSFVLVTRYDMQRWICPTAVSFYVLVFHEPLQAYIKKVSYLLLNPKGELEMLLLYFSVPLLTVFVCVFIYIMLSKIVSKRIMNLLIGR